jgi:hypothetical protein
MPRRIADWAGVPELNDLPQVDDRHSLAHVTDNAEVMADKEIALAQILAQLQEQIEHLGVQRHVQSRGRLVGNDELGLQRDGAMPIR